MLTYLLTVMVYNGMSSSTGWLTGSGFDLPWFGPLSFEHLSIFGLRAALGPIYLIFLLHPLLYLVVI